MTEQSKVQVQNEKTSPDGWQWFAVVDGELFTASLATDRNTIGVYRIEESGASCALLPFAMAAESAEQTKNRIASFDDRARIASLRALAYFREASLKSPPPSQYERERFIDRQFRESKHLIQARDTEPEELDPLAELRGELQWERQRSGALFEALESVTSGLELMSTQPRLAANEQPRGILRFGQASHDACECMKEELEASKEAASTYRDLLVRVTCIDPQGQTLDNEQESFLRAIARIQYNRRDSGDWRAWAMQRLTGGNEAFTVELSTESDSYLREQLEAEMHVFDEQDLDVSELRAWQSWASELLGEVCPSTPIEMRKAITERSERGLLATQYWHDREQWRELACELADLSDPQDADEELRAALREAFKHAFKSPDEPTTEPDTEIRDVAVDVQTGKPLLPNAPPINRGEYFELGGTRYRCVQVLWVAGRGHWIRAAHLEQLSNRGNGNG